MTNLQQAATHFADTKPHYALLDCSSSPKWTQKMIINYLYF